MILSYDMISENFRRTDREQTDREFNYRGHSYPLWIVGVSGPILWAIFGVYNIAVTLSLRELQLILDKVF